MTLPKTIYVRQEPDNDGTTYLVAETTIAEAIKDDGPTTIGVYVLQEKKRARKVVQS